MSRENMFSNKERGQRTVPVWIHEKYFDLMEDGIDIFRSIDGIADERHIEKTVEVRPSTSDLRNVRIGDCILFRTSGSSRKGNRTKTCRRYVVSIREYPDLQTLVDSEDVEKILPGETTKEALIAEAATIRFNSQKPLIAVELSREPIPKE